MPGRVSNIRAAPEPRKGRPVGPFVAYPATVALPRRRRGEITRRIVAELLGQVDIGQMFFLVVGTGLLLGVFGSFVAIRRHLKV